MNIFEKFPKNSKKNENISIFSDFLDKILEILENFPKKMKTFSEKIWTYFWFFSRIFFGLEKNIFLKIIFTYIDPKFPQDSKNRT